MGNFYTNVVVRADHDRVADVLRSRRRDAFVADSDGATVVVDREADKQDKDELASVAVTLSAALSAPALACINHDDDALILGLYGSGTLIMEYGWSKSLSFPVPKIDRSKFVAEVRLRFMTTARRAPAFPDVPNLPEMPYGLKLALRAINAIGNRFLAVGIHENLLDEMGLSRVSAGAGFASVERGDFNHRENTFRRV